MKIALLCDSLLLSSTLEMHLKENLSSFKNCDFVVANKPQDCAKPVFLIGDFDGANLKMPFTRELLMAELSAFFKANCSEQAQSLQHTANSASAELSRPLPARDLPPLSSTAPVADLSAEFSHDQTQNPGVTLEQKVAALMSEDTTKLVALLREAK